MTEINAQLVYFDSLDGHHLGEGTLTLLPVEFDNVRWLHERVDCIGRQGRLPGLPHGHARVLTVVTIAGRPPVLVGLPERNKPRIEFPDVGFEYDE